MDLEALAASVPQDTAPSPSSAQLSPATAIISQMHKIAELERKSTALQKEIAERTAVLTAQREELESLAAALSIELASVRSLINTIDPEHQAASVPAYGILEKTKEEARAISSLLPKLESNVSAAPARAAQETPTVQAGIRQIRLTQAMAAMDRLQGINAVPADVAIPVRYEDLHMRPGSKGVTMLQVMRDLGGQARVPDIAKVIADREGVELNDSTLKKTRAYIAHLARTDCQYVKSVRWGVWSLTDAGLAALQILERDGSAAQAAS